MVVYPEYFKKKKKRMRPDFIKKLEETAKADFTDVDDYLSLIHILRFIVPRVRMRTLGSACAKKQKKRLSISGSNSLNFGLNI